MDGTDPIVRAVQEDIDREISVYDAAFKRQRERFGEPFVHEYLSEVCTHMAVAIVRAFEEHDRKRYQRCAKAFGTVYTFLFPVSRVDAHTAGSGYALALKNHDAIEDGVDVVAVHEPITAGYIEEDDRIPLKAREILDHPYWNTVLFCFELVAGTLGLPHAYAEEQTEFFRYHTAAQEALNRAGAVNRYLGPKAMNHARRAQTAKFSVFFEDADTLETVADVYLAAVRSHDAHTMAEQEADIGRMIDIYDRALATTVGVAPLADRVAAMTPERAGSGRSDGRSGGRFLGEGNSHRSAIRRTAGVKADVGGVRICAGARVQLNENGEKELGGGDRWVALGTGHSNQMGFRQ